MPSELFRKHDRAVRTALASDLGCEVSAFETNALTIVPRPVPPREACLALVATFGTGTVLSIDRGYIDWAKANVPETHFRTFFDVFLQPLVAEGRNRSENLVTRHAGLWFTLAEILPHASLPAGLRYSNLEGDVLDQAAASKTFHNALADPGDSRSPERFLCARAVLDAEANVVACAGAYREGPGIAEIGVDVLRAWRGNGLASAIVADIAREIQTAGLTPTYSCGATNVRSHRTALAAGFLPVCSLAAVGRDTIP